MILKVIKYDIHPDRVEAYLKRTEGALKRKLAVPGIVEFRAYRGTAGARQVLLTHEFADLASWAAWRSNKEVEQVWDELHALAVNVTNELWSPSSVVPKPIRL